MSLTDPCPTERAVTVDPHTLRVLWSVPYSRTVKRPCAFFYQCYPNCNLVKSWLLDELLMESCLGSGLPSIESVAMSLAKAHCKKGRNMPFMFAVVAVHLSCERLCVGYCTELRDPVCVGGRVDVRHYSSCYIVVV